MEGKFVGKTAHNTFVPSDLPPNPPVASDDESSPINKKYSFGKTKSLQYLLGNKIPRIVGNKSAAISILLQSRSSIDPAFNPRAM
ncbi:MAG: hypothetical protein LBF43_03115 [Puniceicoccales bacterium]|jgi:hypothetical protein|nr:hypothetical protein [Puniceicoccales bacterium]